MLNEWSTIDNIKKISPDWKIVPLQKFSSSDKNSFVNGPFGSDLLSSELVDEGQPVIYIRDIKDGRYQRKSEVCVTTEKYHALTACQVNFGDVVIAKVGDPPCEAAVYDVNQPGVVTQDVIRIKTAEFGRSQFLAFLLNSDIGKRQVKRIKIAGTRERVSLTDFKKIKFPHPPVSEQKKIAQILSTWDQAIATTERLLDLARQQKKALMQQLLTGKKRFPGFEGAWKWLRANQLFKTISKKKNADDEELLSVTQDQGVLPRSMLERRVVMPDGATSGYKLVVPGNFIISLRSFQGGLEYSRYRGLVSPAYTVLEPIKEICDDFYMHYYKSYDFIGHLAVAVIGIRDGKQISYEDFSFLKLPYPAIEEQKKIASVLSAADQEIETLQSQLDGLKQEKKALMQVLLTGERRVQLN